MGLEGSPVGTSSTELEEYPTLPKTVFDLLRVDSVVVGFEALVAVAVSGLDRPVRPVELSFRYGGHWV